MQESIDVEDSDIRIQIRELSQEISVLEKQLQTKRNHLVELKAKQNAKIPDGVSYFSSVDDKVKLFRSLFHGREDVFAQRFESKKTGKAGYQPVCENLWVSGICQKPKIKCVECKYRKLSPLDDSVITDHLTGYSQKGNSGADYVIGIYPMLSDETSHFLAMDFDKDSWNADSCSVLEVCNTLGIPAYRERSRSGNGAHIWIFFREAISARVARMMGTVIISKAIDNRPEIGMESFDRFFPNQDTMPSGGFGNLIALPLQKKPRGNHNSVFINIDGEEYPDQWAFLDKCDRISEQQILAVIEENREIVTSFNTGPYDSETSDEYVEKPWNYRTQRSLPVISEGLPAKLHTTVRDQIYVPKLQLPAILRSRLLWLASFSNPEFYKAQAMRLPTWKKPRILYCYDVFTEYIGLPVGLLPELMDLMSHYNINLDVEDQRVSGSPIDISFVGNLYPEQQKACGALLSYENGILSATTAFGKTVIAAQIIAERKVNTLVLVHRKQLMEQWKSRIEAFTTFSGKQIGQFGGGRKKRTGEVDIAVIQSVYRNGEVPEWIEDYGQIIIDECHHISAFSFEQVIRRCPAKYKLGLSATITRKDGQHPIVLMNIGKVRYSVSAKMQASKRSFSHHVHIKETSFRIPIDSQSIQDVFKAVIINEQRNTQVLDDVRMLYCKNRKILIITERKEHIDILNESLQKEFENLFVLQGGLGKKQLKRIMKRLSELNDSEPRIILATGRYLGEGFDLPILDTLLLVFPVSWKGTIAQYAGRLHREYEGKDSVEIYDYLDSQVPVLSKMYKRRQKGYKSLGYTIS